MKMTRIQKHDNAFSATLTGILDLFKKKKPELEHAWADNIKGKTCLVTGANRGLGRATAVRLAELGGYVVMACRSGILEAGEYVRKKSGSNLVETVYIDLADLRTVLRFCDDMKERGMTFDIVVLNAGVVAGKYRTTSQGYEVMFGVNFLANFLLVTRLLNNGTVPNKVFFKKEVFSKKGASEGSQTHSGLPRIVFVTSETHRTAEPVDYNELDRTVEYGMSGSLAEYGRSKLLLSTFSSELTRRLKRGDNVEVSVHSLCPGPVNSGIAREAPALILPLLKLVFFIFFRSPKKACEPVVYLCSSRSLEGKTGIYLHIMEQKEASQEAMNTENGIKLWNASEKLVNNFIP
jgi:NAD(P)-dependent dehydrogenase (short-subunit alcohol dehydrogenase family)